MTCRRGYFQPVLAKALNLKIADENWLIGNKNIIYIVKSGRLFSDIEHQTRLQEYPFFNGMHIDSIHMGECHSVIRADGKFFFVGGNKFGQLGLDDVYLQREPIEHPFFKDKPIDAIDLGDRQSFIRSNGHLYVMGSNNCGALGLGDIQMQSTPISHPFFENKHIDSVYPGKKRAFICSDGKLFVMGLNRQHGQLGLRDKKFQRTPIEHPFFKGKHITSIVLGDFQSFVCADGKLYVFGSNELGCLGLGDIEQQRTPVEHPFFIDKHVEAIYTNDGSTFVCADGKLFVMGSNKLGKLGIGNVEVQQTPIEHPFFKGKRIMGIYQHHYRTFIIADETLFVIGSNYRGRLGLGEVEAQRIPIVHPDFKNKHINAIHLTDNLTFIYANGKLFMMGDEWIRNVYCGLGAVESMNEISISPIEKPIARWPYLIDAPPVLNINTIEATIVELQTTPKPVSNVKAESRTDCPSETRKQMTVSTEYISTSYKATKETLSEPIGVTQSTMAIASPSDITHQVTNVRQPISPDIISPQSARNTLDQLLKTYDSSRGFFRRYCPGVPGQTKTIQALESLLHSNADITQEDIVNVLEARDHRNSKTRKSQIKYSVKFFNGRQSVMPTKFSATDQVIAGLRDHFENTPIAQSF